MTIDPLTFYRVKRYGKRLPFTRFLGYPLLGMAVGPEGAFFSFPFLRYLADGLAIVSILAFSYALNDYFDFLLEGESNYLGECLKKEELTRRQALSLTFLPLLPLPLFLFPLPRLSLSLLSLFLLILAVYSLPPVRINRRPKLKFFISVSSAFLLTLQASLLSGHLSRSVWGLLVVVSLFHCYVTSFHHLEEFGGWRGLLWVFPLFSLLLSPFLLPSPLFLLTIFFSLLRLGSWRGGDFHALRSRLFGPPLFSEELLGYALLGLAGVL